MKIYTNTFDLRQPSEKKFWVAPNSDFKIGIKVLGYNGTEMFYPPSSIDLYKDSEKLTVDSNDGRFAYWKIKSEDTGEVTYTIKAKRNNKVVGELKLTQVVTDSTVFDQEQEQEVNLDNLEDIKVNGTLEVQNGNIKTIILPEEETYDNVEKTCTITTDSVNSCTINLNSIESVRQSNMKFTNDRSARYATNGINIVREDIDIITQSASYGEVDINSSGVLLTKEDKYGDFHLTIDENAFYINTPNYTINLDNQRLIMNPENGNSFYGFDFENNAVILQNAIFAPKEINGEMVLAYYGDYDSGEA